MNNFVWDDKLLFPKLAISWCCRWISWCCSWVRGLFTIGWRIWFSLTLLAPPSIFPYFLYINFFDRFFTFFVNCFLNKSATFFIDFLTLYSWLTHSYRFTFFFTLYFREITTFFFIFIFTNFSTFGSSIVKGWVCWDLSSGATWKKMRLWIYTIAFKYGDLHLWYLRVWKKGSFI